MTLESYMSANSYFWDGENRMTAYSGYGGVASYGYDGNGLRVTKSVQGGTTTVSIYSGSSVIAEYDDGAATDAPSREYVYNGASVGDTTQLLAMISDGATTYYHQDLLSVRLSTDETGAPLSQEGHFPFGEPWYQSGPGNKWFFTSYNRDQETGLDYALARYYDSRTGTFLMADPVAGSLGDPQSWNRYPYGRNDPIDVIDPSGQSFWSDLLGVGLWASTFFTGGATTEMAEAYTFANSMNDAGNAFSSGHYLAGVLDLGMAATAGAGLAAANGPPAGGGSGNAPPMQESLGFPNYGAFAKMTAGSLSQALGLPSSSGCEFGACGGGPMSATPSAAGTGQAAAQIASHPWILSWILPLAGPIPGVMGVGPAGDVEYNPKTHTLCAGIGVGGSVGKNVAFGPLLWGKSFTKTKWPENADDILGGWSVSGGGNLPFPTPVAGLGVQGAINTSGMAAGPTAGAVGVSGAVTWSHCTKLW